MKNIKKMAQILAVLMLVSFVLKDSWVTRNFIDRNNLSQDMFLLAEETVSDDNVTIDENVSEDVPNDAEVTDIESTEEVVSPVSETSNTEDTEYVDEPVDETMEIVGNDNIVFETASAESNTTETSSEEPEITVTSLKSYIDNSNRSEQFRVVVNGEEIPYDDTLPYGRDVSECPNGYYFETWTRDWTTIYYYPSFFIVYNGNNYTWSGDAHGLIMTNNFFLGNYTSSLPSYIELNDRNDYTTIENIISNVTYSNEYTNVGTAYCSYEILGDTSKPISGNSITIKAIAPHTSDVRGYFFAEISNETEDICLNGRGRYVTVNKARILPEKYIEIPVIFANEPVSMRTSIPKGYVIMDSYYAINKDSIMVKADGNVLDSNMYEIENVRLNNDNTKADFNVTATYYGRTYSVHIEDVRTSYDLNVYNVNGLPENITIQNANDHRAVEDAIENIVLENDYETITEDNSNVFTVSHSRTTPIDADGAIVTLTANGLYTFGGKSKIEYKIPVTIAEETREDTPEIPSENPVPSNPNPTFNQPSQPSTPEVDDNRKTITASGRGYKAVISMNKVVPYSKNKKVIANSLNVTCTVTDKNGNSCNIRLKSVKATKPKNGYSKVTITLKGNGKIEKKAVKAMNKALKKIRVNVEGTNKK